MSLSALRVRHAKPGRHGDGHGLYLQVSDTGSASWILRIQRRNCRRDFGLGSALDVSLADARALASDYRRLFKGGVDPIEAIRPRVKARPSFESVARDCYEALRPGWRDGRHVSWLASLENHVFPSIGSKSVGEVDSAAVLAVLEPIWSIIPETSRRILQRIGTVLDFAHIKGHIEEEVSLRSVTRGLPRLGRQATHFAAMPYVDVPAFVRALMGMPSTTGRDSLQLTILTAVRSSESRKAVWGEFDLDNAIWAIPAERMKMREVHLVPLAPAAVRLLRRLRRTSEALDGPIKPDRLVFSATGKAPISDVTMLKVLRDMETTSVTVHGFRSSFTDWAAEQTTFPKEVADKALAHRIPNSVEAAYRRTAFLEKRRELMSLWAEFVMAPDRNAQLSGELLAS